MDHVEPVENGLQVEGILTVDILYATTDDSFPIAHTQEQIPFTQIVDVPGMKGHTEDISYEIEPAIDQLAVNLLDNERFEVKAVISLQTIVQQEVCMEKIVDIHKEPLDAVELMKQPGIVGYIVKKEEQLWDIARHFHTTEAEIMETNGLKSADVQQGDKLLIVKKVRNVRIDDRKRQKEKVMENERKRNFRTMHHRSRNHRGIQLKRGVLFA